MNGRRCPRRNQEASSLGGACQSRVVASCKVALSSLSWMGLSCWRPGTRARPASSPQGGKGARLDCSPASRTCPLVCPLDATLNGNSRQIHPIFDSVILGDNGLLAACCGAVAGLEIRCSIQLSYRRVIVSRYLVRSPELSSSDVTGFVPQLSPRQITSAVRSASCPT